MSQAKNDQEGSRHSKEPIVVYHESELKYFQVEREKLQSARERHLSETKKPERKEYFPNVFNSLEPYTDVQVYSIALDAPVETDRYRYKTRQTAAGLCDPWVSYDMDINFQVDSSPATASSSSSKSKRPSTDRSQGNDKKERKSVRDRNERDETKQSWQDSKQDQKTGRAPIYPTVKAVPNELTGKSLNYSHVPQLRDELRKTYSANADRRIKEAYKLTKDEFHRRQLDRVGEYHPDSWPTMRSAYFAYLQNNPGSTRAVRECVRDAEKEKRRNNKDKAEKQQDATNEGAAFER